MFPRNQGTLWVLETWEAQLALCSVLQKFGLHLPKVGKLAKQYHCCQRWETEAETWKVSAFPVSEVTSQLSTERGVSATDTTPGHPLPGYQPDL